MPTYKSVMAYTLINISQSGTDFNGDYKPSVAPIDGKSRSFYRSPEAPKNAHISVVDYGGEFDRFHISLDFGNKNIAIWYYYQADRGNLSSRIENKLPSMESAQFNSFYTSAVAGSIDRLALEFAHFCLGDKVKWQVYSQDYRELFRY